MSIQLCGIINFILFFINALIYMQGRSIEFVIVAVLNAIAASACLARFYYAT